MPATHRVVPRKDLLVAAALYNLDPTDLTALEPGVNAVFASPTLYVRLTRPAIRDLAEVVAVQRFLAHVASLGAPVCAPVRTAGGALAATAGNHVASAVTAMPGRPLSEHERDPTILSAFGASLAALHDAAASYQGPVPWDLRRMWARARPHLSSGRPDLLAAHPGLDAWLASLPDDDFAIVHGDMRPANAIVHESAGATTVYIVDFDEPARGWPAYDIAHATMYFEDDQDLVGAFLSGYRAQRTLDDEWVRRLSRLATFRRLLMVAWSLEEGDRDSPFVTDLCARLLRAPRHAG